MIMITANIAAVHVCLQAIAIIRAKRQEILAIKDTEVNYIPSFPLSIRLSILFAIYPFRYPSALFG